MDDLKHLREKRGSLAKQMKDLYDKAKAEERGLSADERTQWDKMSDDVSNYDADIKRFEDLEKVSGELGKTFERKADERQISRDEAKDRSGKAFRNFLLSRIGLADFTDENKRDLFENPFKEFRTNAQSTTDAKGGYTIPEGFSNELAIAMKAWGGMTEVARILRTASGNDIPWPATNDTANVAYQVDEAANLETSASDATFSKAVTLKAYKWTSGLVRVSPEILTDSYFDFERILIDLFALRMGRGLNAAYTTGAGGTTISGVVTGATDASLSSVAATALSYNNLVDLMHSVDPAYRGNARWMFNDATLKAIRKIVDENDVPLWQPNITMGSPDMILGKPFTINQDVADIGASAKSVLFGDFKNYVIREVVGDRIRILSERFADTDQIGIVLLQRRDGQLVDAGTHPIKYLVHAAS